MGESNEEKAERLKAEVKEEVEEAEAAQRDLIDAVRDETTVIETQANLAGDVVVDVQLPYTGDMIDRFAAVENRLQDTQQTGNSVAPLQETADDICQILADATENPHYDKDYWYEIYEETGLGGVGAHFETISKAVEREVKRLQGEADGFRGESGR